MNPWIIPALAFTAAAFLVGGLFYALTTSERRLGRRLEEIKQGDAPPRRKREERPDHFPTLTAALQRAGRHSAIEQYLDRAGLNWRPSELTAAGLLLVVVLGGLGWLALGPLAAAGGIVVAVVAPLLVLKALEARRLRQFDQQLADALMLISSSLRSGYGILRAVQAVRDEMQPPISLEFGKTLDETNVGVPISEALVHLAERVRLPDLDIAVTAILIQLEVGGNLAEVLEIVAGTVRERHRLRAEMDTLTAEGRLSGVILFALPLGMAVILGVLNPAYMSALFKTGLGHFLIGLGAAMQIVGGLVIHRMLRFDF
jgi:tight adherence protein B